MRSDWQRRSKALADNSALIAEAAEGRSHEPIPARATRDPATVTHLTTREAAVTRYRVGSEAASAMMPPHQRAAQSANPADLAKIVGVRN